MSKSLPVLEVVYLPTDILDKDMFCSRCGYNLRGLTPDSLCPECSFPAARSIYGNMLLYADPNWISKIRLGILIKLLNFLLVVIIGYGIEYHFFENLPQALLTFLKFMCGCISLISLFLITTYELNISVIESWYSLRKIVRLVAIIAFVADQFQQAALGWNVVWYFIEFDLLVTALVTIVLAGEFTYLRRLARRSQNNKLISNTTIVMWGLVLSRVMLLILSVVGVAISYSIGNSVLPDQQYILDIVVEIAEGFNVLLFFSLGVFTIWEFVLLIQYFLELKVKSNEL